MANDFKNNFDGIVNRISARLADFDVTVGKNSTWDRCLVEATARDALCIMASLRPELFTKEVSVPLANSACVQRLPKECESLTGFLCIEDEDGNQIPITEGDYDSVSRVVAFPPVRRRFKCDVGRANSSDVAQFTVAQHPRNPRLFAIAPQPPPGSNYKIIGECVDTDQITADPCVEISNDLKPWIVPWIELTMYQLLSTDSTDATVAARAQQHVSMFIQLTSINMQQLETLLRREATA